MREKYQCPECSKKAMIKLQLLERWWCKSCDAEIDVDQTIKQWALNGYNRKDS
jgi:ribosomal protein L37AE/L43A